MSTKQILFIDTKGMDKVQMKKILENKFHWYREATRTLTEKEHRQILANEKICTLTHRICNRCGEQKGISEYGFINEKLQRRCRDCKSGDKSAVKEFTEKEILYQKGILAAKKKVIKAREILSSNYVNDLDVIETVDSVDIVGDEVEKFILDNVRHFIASKKLCYVNLLESAYEYLGQEIQKEVRAKSCVTIELPVRIDDDAIKSQVGLGLAKIHQETSPGVTFIPISPDDIFITKKNVVKFVSIRRKMSPEEVLKLENYMVYKFALPKLVEDGDIDESYLAFSSLVKRCEDANEGKEFAARRLKAQRLNKFYQDCVAFEATGESIGKIRAIKYHPSIEVEVFEEIARFQKICDDREKYLQSRLPKAGAQQKQESEQDKKLSAIRKAFLANNIDTYEDKKAEIKAERILAEDIKKRRDEAEKEHAEAERIRDEDIKKRHEAVIKKAKDFLMRQTKEKKAASIEKNLKKVEEDLEAIDKVETTEAN